MRICLCPCLGAYALAVMFPEPARSARSQRQSGANQMRSQGSQTTGDREGGGQVLSPGIYQRSSNEPPGLKQSPHAPLQMLLLLQREAFDSDQQLSDGTNLPALHSSSLYPHIFALPTSPTPDFVPLQLQPFFPCSMKTTTDVVEKVPPIGSSHQEKGITILWARPAKRKREKKGGLPLL